MVVLTGLSGSGKTRYYNALNDRIEAWHRQTKPNLFTRSMSMDNYSSFKDEELSANLKRMADFAFSNYDGSASMLLILEGQASMAASFIKRELYSFSHVATIWAILVPDVSVFQQANALKLAEATKDPESKQLLEHWGTWWKRVVSMTPAAVAKLIQKETKWYVDKAVSLFGSSAIKAVWTVSNPSLGTPLRGWEPDKDDVHPKVKTNSQIS